jgi:cytochrome c553
MTNIHKTVRTVFVLVVAGIVVASYLAAQTAISSRAIPNKPTPNKSISNKSTIGAQVVAQGTTRGAVACARCHGFDGASDGSGAFPRLDGQSSQYLAQQLRHFASGARQNALMQPIAKGLKDDEIDAVAQYYANLHPVPFPPRPVSEQVRDLGKQVAEVGDLSARVQACESCHGPNGEGEPIAGVPYLGGQYNHYIRIQIRMFRQGYRKSEQMLVPAHNLSEQDIVAVAAYFEQAPRPAVK